MTILEEAHQSIIIVEHDPMLYKDAAEMVEYISYALADAAKDAAFGLGSLSCSTKLLLRMHYSNRPQIALDGWHGSSPSMQSNPPPIQLGLMAWPI